MYDNEEDYDMIFKILIIGDSGVGKSNLLLRYVKNEFMSDMRSTVGVEFGSKLLTIDNVKVKAQIWDTAGQERYRAITSAYYKGAKGVLIVYDITRRESFTNLDKWLTDFKMKCDDDAAIVIIGNKSDLQSKREVDKEEAALKAQSNHLAFFETSAKENENVNIAFLNLMQQVVKNVKASMDEKFTKSNTNSNNDKKMNGKKINTNDKIRLEDNDEEKMFSKEKKCCGGNNK